MKVAILTNNLPSFNKVMAQGLERMLCDLGIEARVYYDGHDRLRRLNWSETSLAYWLWYEIKFYRFLAAIRDSDLIVLVSTTPKAFVRSDHAHIETLRKWLPGVPIVLYDVALLPMLPERSIKRLREGGHHWVPTGGNFELERFDWYLTVAERSYRPLPEGDWPVTVIGLNLDDGTLYSGQNSEFLALVDFEMPEYVRERAEQILALEEASISYLVLHGSYSIREIRNLYRRTSLYFLASPESFGLPICELQACGAYILVPHEDWCPAHWIDDRLVLSDSAKLSPNFVIYQEKETLIRHLTRLRREHEAQQVVRTFLQYNPQFYYGDAQALAAFVEKIHSGEIHSRLHAEHAGLLNACEE